jgi:hypothetical protein
MYDVDPKIYIIYDQKLNAIEGSCMPAYRVDRMFLEVIIPRTYITFGKKRKLEVAATLMHEYGHYLTDLYITGKERIKLSDEYNKSLFVRRCVEQANWTTTKQIAQNLGMWNKEFYKVCRESYYTSYLKY